MIKKFKLSFKNSNKSSLIGCIIGLIFSLFLIIVPIVVSGNKGLLYFLPFPVLFIIFGMIIMWLSLNGSIVLTDCAIKINYGLSYVNKIIKFDSIIEIDYIKGYENIPSGDPAKGDKRTVLKIEYNDADYKIPQEIFISVKQHKELLTLIEERTRNST